MQFQIASLLAIGLAVGNVLAAPVSGDDALVSREEQAAQTSNDFIDDAIRAAGDFSAAYQNNRDYPYGRNPYDRYGYYDGPYQNGPYGRHRYRPGYDRYGYGRGPWRN